MEKGNWKALLPIGVFLIFYLDLGLIFEYVMKIPMGFYNIPIVVSFLIALLVACIQNPKLKFNDKLQLMAKGVGDKNIVTIILIFLTAGIFVGVVGRNSAESVAYFLLSVIPARFAVIVLFVISPQTTTSILDTFSCISQGIIPYGAQMLVAVSAAAELGCQVSAFDIMPNLFYPFMLLISSLIFIFFAAEKKK